MAPIFAAIPGLYWPSLRKVILELPEDGFVPYLFAEGARIQGSVPLSKRENMRAMVQTAKKFSV